MRRFLILFLAVCTACAAWAAPRITPDGEILCGPLRLRLAWFDGEWRMTGQERGTVFPAPGYPLEQPELFELEGTLRLFHDAGELRLTERVELLPGALKYRAALRGKPGMPCRSAALILELPVAEFGGKTLKADGRPVTLDAVSPAAAYPELRAERIAIPLPEGELVISGKLTGYLQDERNYGGNFYSLRLLGTPEPGAETAFSWELRFDGIETGVTLRPADKAEIFPVDISRAANMAWRDETAGDGKGGWTDQGENDVRDLTPGRQVFFDVPFELLDPGRNGGKSCMVFSGPDREYLLKSARIDGIGRRGERLYFLHALSWAPEDVRTVATVEVAYTDGTAERLEVKSNRDVCNWWSRVRADNALIAWRGRNPQSETTLYLSGFALDPARTVESLKLTPAGNAVWMVAGISIGGEVPALRPQIRRKITAGKEFRPFEQQFEVEKDSALDFSFLNHVPAGKFGRVVAAGDHFEFAERPGEPVRFYGVNLCWSAHELTHAQSDLLAVRLARLGFNSVRIHHYDMMLTERAQNRLEFDAERLDRLDYLIARLKEAGIYVTIDLYTTRIPAREDVPDIEIRSLHDFRAALPLVPSVRENFKAFARKLLTHRNPYTGNEYRREPAIFSICVVNENLLPAPWKEHPQLPALYRRAFADWCAGKGIAVPAAFDDSPEFRRFLLDLQQQTYDRLSGFLRDELGVRALLSDNNNGESMSQTPERATLDYTDFHGYWEHPVFIEKPWSLPHYYTQESAVRREAAVPRLGMACRILGKPYMITETDYCFPNHRRGEGGLLLGAYAGFQNWSGIYRFAYSHFNTAMFEPAACTMFDSVRDPVNLFADRIGALMFRRFDVQPARRSVPFLFTSDDFPGYAVYPADYTRAGLLTGIGSLDASRGQTFAGLEGPAVVTAPAGKAAGVKTVVAADDKLLAGLAAAGAITLPRNGVYRSDTGEITLDSASGTLRVVTPRTEGFVLPAGQAGKGELLELAAPDTFTSCVLTSAGMEPLAESGKLLLFQLTDVMNSGITFRDSENTVLEDYGTLPLLLRRGRIGAALRRGAEKAVKVRALDMAGRRTAELPVSEKAGRWHFTLDNSITEEAVLCYEIERIF